jgi:hypothetical protein
VTGLVFGIFPALHSTRPDLVSALKGQAGQPSGAKTAARFRIGLVTLQITMSMFLLMSAGLFVKSLANVSRVNLGLQLDNVITFAISPDLNGYDVTRTRALYERIEEQLRRSGRHERRPAWCRSCRAAIGAAAYQSKGSRPAPIRISRASTKSAPPTFTLGIL